MDKSEALKIIFNCAKLYKENLVNRNLLFISLVNGNKFIYIETKFLKFNYLHLTGIDVCNDKVDANSFYDRCLRYRLSEKDFNFKENGTTIQKLEVLPQLMNIHKVTHMMGNYNGTQLNLYTDKLVGNTRACF